MLRLDEAGLEALQSLADLVDEKRRTPEESSSPTFFGDKHKARLESLSRESGFTVEQIEAEAQRISLLEKEA